MSLSTLGWKVYRRHGDVTVSGSEDGPVEVKSSTGSSWRSSWRSIRLCYDETDQKGVYRPKCQPVIAVKLQEDTKFTGNGKERVGLKDEYLVAWGTKWDNQNDLWTVDSDVFSSRYVEHEVVVQESSGFDVGFASLQGKRESNEDAHLTLSGWSDETALLGVFDGHGGVKCSAFCAKRLPEELASRWSGEKEEAFREAFVATDRAYLEKRRDDGSTALVAVVGKGQKKNLWVANAGDSRCVVVRGGGGGGGVEALSKDHKPSDGEEKSRIEKASFEVRWDTLVQHGKRVKVARVDGQLAVSRAIGDDQFKDEDEPPEQWAVTSVPQVKKSTLEDGDILVLACDGLWDVCDNAAVAQLVTQFKQNGKNAEQIAQSLAKHAIDEKGSDDNVTIVIALF